MVYPDAIDNDRILTEVLTREDGTTVHTITHSYDDNGNLISRVQETDGTTETTTYTWNDDDRLVAVETPEGNIIAYDYDDEGIRVSATVDGETTEFLVDKNRPYAQVLEELSSDQLQTFYVYGHDLISQTRNAEQDFYQVDGLGSTRALADEEGNVTDTYDYEAFGELIDLTGESENSYRFTGEQFDEGLGDYYLRDRFYDQQTGRFLRKDVYEGQQFEPLTLHKYLYTHNNPVNFIDPTGLFTMSEISAANAVRMHLTEQYAVFAGDFALQASSQHSQKAREIKIVFDFINGALQTLTTFKNFLDLGENIVILGAIWTGGRKGNPVQNAYNHWKKHRNEFPTLRNSKNYVDFSHDFVKNPPATAHVKQRLSNRDTVIYDPVSDIFAVADSSGQPRTVFKPDPAQHGYATNLDYFNAQ